MDFNMALSGDPTKQGYPPNPTAPLGMEMTMGIGYPPPHQGPPPGYAYPPVPVAVPGAIITSQPNTQMGCPPPTYGDTFSMVAQQPAYGLPPPNVGYAPQPVPFMAQPIQTGQPVPHNTPPGLEYLTQLNTLIVKQEVELAEVVLGFETNNRYKIKDLQGRDLYRAKEDTNCCVRQCCGPKRPFNIKITDMSGREVIHLSRPLACSSCWFPCCLQSLEVFAPPGQLAGTVEQQWSLCSPQYSIKDALGNVVLRIDGPFCTLSMCGDVEFQVMSSDGKAEVGKISKKWSGLLQEVFTDADNFGISFPKDLDVKIKAVVLGACLLIDFMFFEEAPDNN